MEELRGWRSQSEMCIFLHCLSLWSLHLNSLPSRGATAFFSYVQHYQGDSWAWEKRPSFLPVRATSVFLGPPNAVWHCLATHILFFYPFTLTTCLQLTLKPTPKKIKGPHNSVDCEDQNSTRQHAHGLITWLQRSEKQKKTVHRWENMWTSVLQFFYFYFLNSCSLKTKLVSKWRIPHGSNSRSQ